MALDKKDFTQIEQMFFKFEKSIQKQILTSAEETKKALRQEIQTSAMQTKKELRQGIQFSENRVVAVLSREIADLAAINRAVILKN